MWNAVHSTTVTTLPTRHAPVNVSSPYCMPSAMPGVTNTKLFSRQMGSRAPIGPTPSDWTTVAIPVTSRQPATRIVISAVLSPTPPPMSSGTGRTLKIRMRMCCRLSGIVSLIGGHSLSP